MSGFIFGGNTGETQASLKRKRALAQVMLERGVNAPARNLGEGISSAASSISGALIGRAADRRESKEREAATSTLASALEAHAAAQKSGMANDTNAPEPLLSVSANEWLTDGQRGLLQALMARQSKQAELARSDFEYDRALEDKREDAGTKHGRSMALASHNASLRPAPASYDTLSADEVSELGLPAGTVVQRSSRGQLSSVGGGLGITPPQAANNQEILGARQKLEAMAKSNGYESVEDFVRDASIETDQYGRGNPLYNPVVHDLYRTATNYAVGGDPGFASFHGVSATPSASAPGASNDAGPQPTPIPMEGGVIQPASLEVGGFYDDGQGGVFRWDGNTFQPAK